MTVASPPAYPAEPVDALVWRTTGRTAGVVEQLLDSTPGLAARALALSQGEIVHLPDAPAAETVALVQLWD